MDRYNDAEARFLHADALMSNGEIVEAKDILIGILEDEPDYGRAHNHLGWIYVAKLSDYERAGYHLRLAVKFAPDYPAGYFNYGNFLIETGDWEQLGKLAEKALQVTGMYRPYVYRFFAAFHEMSGRPKMAMKFLKQARIESLDQESLVHIESEIKRLKNKMNAFSRISLIF